MAKPSNPDLITRRSYHPLYEAAKCLGSLRRKPVVLGGLAQLYGYAWAAWRNVRTELPPDVVAFNRRQQLRALRNRLVGRSGATGRREPRRREAPRGRRGHGA